MAASVQGSENKTVQSNSATLTSVLNKLVVLVREKPIILILLSAVVAYYGALFLGLSMDDFAALDRQKNQAWIDLARRPGNNRFPLFALVVLPLLLQLPGWLAHLLIIAAHTTSAILLFRLLLWFDLDEVTATLAALLFLLWPVHAEALFWLVGSTVVFGVCLVLVGTLLLTRNHVFAAIALIFVGITFSEGILIPALFLQLVVLLRRRTGIRKLVLFGGSILGLYGVFQILRRLVSISDQIAQYPTGLDNALLNIKDLVLMSLGLASSHDVAWMWEYAVRAKDVGLLLPARILFIAMIVMLPVALALRSFNRAAMAQRKPRDILQAIFVVLLGYGSALLIFVIVAGNPMQNRYTYTSVVYLTVLIALPIGWLFARQRRLVSQLGAIFVVALLSWSVYRIWSNIWANWYPAKQLSERLVADIQQTYKETQAPHIFLVNAPQAVGNAYSLGTALAYRAVGRMYVNPTLEVTGGDIPIMLYNGKLTSGSRFSQERCVFLGWRGGQRVVDTLALDARKHLLLNCRTGMVNEAPPDVSVPLVFHYLERASQENLREVIGQ